MRRNIKFIHMTFAVLGLLSGTACDDDITGFERGELSWERIYSSNGTQYFSMTVSADGILYVGALREILRYDENEDSMVVVREDGGALSLATSRNGTIYAGTLNNGMLRLSNNGRSWVEINSGLGWPDVYDIDFNGADQIFIATSEGVFLSSDDGSNWTPIPIDPTESRVRTLAVSPNGSVFVADAWVSGVYRSINNGASWRKVIDFHASEIAVNSKGDIFAGAATRSPSDIIRSTDEGVTWKGIDPFVSNNKVSSIVFDSQGDVYLVNPLGIFRSFDNGDTWFAANDGLPSSIISTMTVSKNDVFYCGFDSKGIYRGTFARR